MFVHDFPVSMHADRTSYFTEKAQESVSCPSKFSFFETYDGDSMENHFADGKIWSDLNFEDQTSTTLEILSFKAFWE